MVDIEIEGTLHLDLYKPLGISDVYYCNNLRVQNRKRGSVAKRINNASGQRLCLSISIMVDKYLLTLQ